jgi:outer membrane protein
MTHFRKLTATVFLLSSVLAAGLPAQERMTLQQFIDEAVRNSPSVRIAGEAVSGAEFKVREAKSLSLPQVSFASSYTRISLTNEFDFPGFGHFKFSTPDNLNFRLGATEPVFTWGRIAKSVEANRIGVTLAEDGVAMTRQALAFELVPVFYGVLFTREAVKVVDQTLDLLAKKLATLEERYKAGLASDFDISLIKVQMSGLEAQKLDFENNVRKMVLSYNRVAGRPMEATFEPVGELKLEPVAGDARALTAEAIANRPEAKLLADQRRLVQTQMALARTGDKPSVAAAFNYQLQNGFLPSVNRIKGYWNASVGVSYPVFDGRRTGAQVAQTQVALRTVEEQAADVERGFELEILQTLADLKTLELKIEIEKTKIAHAERALEIADERYQNGLISTTDLVEAQDSLDSARLNYLQLITSHILGRYNLLRAAGRTIHS